MAAPVRAVLVLLVCVSLVPGLSAAQSTLGTIRGAVRDVHDQAVAGAVVLVTDEDTGVPRTAESDGSGNYEIACG